MPGKHLPELAAARLLDWLRRRTDVNADKPIPVDALAAELGLTVSAFSPLLIPDTLGYLEPGEDIIFLRAGLPDSVRRFTLAHEIGHAALHRRTGAAAEIAGVGVAAEEASEFSGCADSDLDAVAADDSETLSAGQVYSLRAQREGEANAFAAALLLPALDTRDAYLSLCQRDIAQPALALAQQFGVSEDAALRRLSALLTDNGQLPAESEAPRRVAELDADQLRAARAVAPALALAGPGSGKTSALMARVAYLVGELGVAPENILTLTFSRKAAEELRARLDGVLGAEADALTVSTIHAFCGDTLRRYGPSVGVRADYRLVSDVEGYFLLRRIINAVRLQHYAPQGDPTLYFKDLLDAISQAKDDLVTPEEYRAAAEKMLATATTDEETTAAERAREVATIYEEYQRTLHARGNVDFADLIGHVVRLLRTDVDAANSLRTRYEHVLVDEFQDINFAMGEFLRALVGRRGQIWAVGDVDQAIYRFRGASPANLLRFSEDFDGAQVLALGRNYRSQPQILRAASAFAKVFLPAEERIDLTAERPDAEERRVVALATASDEQAELDGLAALMRSRLAEGVPLNDQAVLVRTRKQVKQISEGLRARGVAAQVAAPLLSEPLVKTLLATLSLTVDSSASGLLRAGDAPDHQFSRHEALAVLEVAHNTGAQPLDVARAGASPAQVSPESEMRLRRLAHLISELNAAPTTATGVCRYVFSLTALGSRLLSGTASADAALVARLLDICRAFDDQRAAGALLGDDETPPEVADWAGLLDYVRALQTLQQPEAIQNVTDTDRVRVMTAHSAKGLEFSAVYLPQLLDKRFPARGQPRHAPAPPGLLRESDTDDEDANLFYVALTRARDTLTLSYAAGPSDKNSPSRYLAPIERALGAELMQLRWTASEPSNGAGPQGTPSRTRRQPAARATYTLNEIESYERCPQQYAYEHVYGLRQPHAAPVSLKIALQRADADLRTRFASQEPPTLDDARRIFDGYWTSARATALAQDVADELVERDESLAGYFQGRGQLAIERHWRRMRQETGPARDAERTARMVSVELGGATVTGAIDLVELEPTPRIVQFVSNKLDKTTNLRDLFYTLAAEKIDDNAKPVKVERLSLATHDTRTINLPPKRRTTLEAEASDLIEGMVRGDYTPKPVARKCQGCPFWLICPA